MKRIICHWTAGTYTASDVDRSHYHYLIDGNGNVVRGKWPVAANEKPVANRYAAHTRGANTGSIGVSLCAMAGAVERPFNAGRYPVKKVQWDAMVRLVADLSKQHGIPVQSNTILSHAEVEGTLKIKQTGKWDYTRLPFAPELAGAAACGARLRADVAWILKPAAAPSKPAEPVPDVSAPSQPATPETPPAARKPATAGFSLWGWLKRLFAASA